MEENEEMNNDDNSFLYTEETIDPFYHNIMNQKINKRLDMVLSNEINKRKKIIYDMFQNNFGHGFIEKRSDSMNAFESLFGKYLFSSKSTFLQKYFPHLYDKLFHNKKKVDLEKLKKKIKLGPLMYLSLRKHLVSNKPLISDKLLYISKNFIKKEDKDLVSNLYHKYKSIQENKQHKKFHDKIIDSLIKKQLSGNMPRVKSNTLLLNRKGGKNNNKLNLNDKKNIKNAIFNIDLKNKINPRIFSQDSNILKKSKTQKNIIGSKNGKNLNTEKNFDNLPNKKFENIRTSGENDNYNNFYLSNPYYLYNSNICKRNNTQYKTSQSESTTINLGNLNSPQISLKNIKQKHITLNPSKNPIIHSKNNSISTKYKTISSFKNIDSNPKMIKNLKFSNEKKNYNSYYHNLNNDIKKELSDNSLSQSHSESINDKNENDDKKVNEKKNEIKIESRNEIRKNFLTLKQKTSFEKRYLRRKNKKFKNKLNSEVQLLNNYTNKCNNKLIKLIDNNFLISAKEKKKKQNKKINFDITRLLLDDEISKKFFAKFDRTKNTIKPIVNRAVKDLTKFDKRNKDLGRKNFIKNINNMPTDLALFFIEELYRAKTSHIKFELKEYKQKRDEIKLLDEQTRIRHCRERAKNNLFKMQKLEYNLLNEKDAYFNGEFMKEMKTLNNENNNNERMKFYNKSFSEVKFKTF